MNRLLVLNYEFPPLGGGGGVVSKKLAESFAERGWKVDVITTGFRNLPFREQISKNIIVYRVPVFRRKMLISTPVEHLLYIAIATFVSLWLVIKNSYTSTHCHFLIPTGLVALFLKVCTGQQYIAIAHGSDVPGYNPDRFTHLHRFTKLPLRLICQNASKVISLSEYLQKLIVSNIASLQCNPVVLIPNGIDSNKFTPLKKKKYILSTGRLVSRKGFQYLIEAGKNIDLGYEIHICGDGPMRPALEKIAHKAKTTVIFHGWLDNSSELYKKLLGEAAIFTLVSEKENASISLLEAMAAECAIITSDQSGTAETIADAGITIQSRSTQALQEKLLSLIDNDKKRIALQKLARKRVLKYYSWQTIVDLYEELSTKDYS